MEQVDYLIIGHVARDLTPAGDRLGGTVAYAGRTAQALGARTAAVTSAAPDYEFEPLLPDIAVHRVPAAETTTFKNVYTAEGRVQTLHGRAAPLTAASIPERWRRASIVHLGPIANEVDPALLDLFTNSIVGVTPQGWLRDWGEDGRIHAREWPAAATVLPRIAAVILSEEDLPDSGLIAQYRQWSRLLVVTEGLIGCTVFVEDEERHIPAPAVTEMEPTGAGDIFAAAFLLRLHQTAGNPWEAARFANAIAAQSVTQDSLDRKIVKIQHYLAERMAT